MGVFGGSSSSSSALNSSIAFNPIITVGDDNDADSKTDQKGSAEATATAKDEFGMSAGLALGPNSSAQGGEITRSGDTQPMNQSPVSNGISSKINPLYVGGALFIVAIGFIIYKKKK